MRGVISSIRAERGFGFIRNGGGTEYFFHMTGVAELFADLRIGQVVSFDVESSSKGPRATNVTITIDSPTR